MLNIYASSKAKIDKYYIKIKSISLKNTNNKFKNNPTYQSVTYFANLFTLFIDVGSLFSCRPKPSLRLGPVCNLAHLGSFLS